MTTSTLTDLALSHYTTNDTLTPHSVEQYNDHPGGKPRGLWVSVDGPDDWAAWCRSEEFRNIDEQNRFAVTLTDDANILHLTTFNELMQFTDDWHVPSEWNGLAYSHEIQWDQVATHWQGIIISPYNWEARYALLWYYGWDCASGCIWNADAIKEVTR